MGVCRMWLMMRRGWLSLLRKTEWRNETLCFIQLSRVTRAVGSLAVKHRPICLQNTVTGVNNQQEQRRLIAHVRSSLGRVTQGLMYLGNVSCGTALASGLGSHPLAVKVNINNGDRSHAG